MEKSAPRRVCLLTTGVLISVELPVSGHKNRYISKPWARWNCRSLFRQEPTHHLRRRGRRGAARRRPSTRARRPHTRRTRITVCATGLRPRRPRAPTRLRRRRLQRSGPRGPAALRIVDATRFHLWQRAGPYRELLRDHADDGECLGETQACQRCWGTRAQPLLAARENHGRGSLPKYASAAWARAARLA